jgi:predicted O-methyltransferase YrrM
MFYLIDAWKTFDLGYNDSNMVTQAEHNRRYSNAIRNLGYHDNIDIVRALSVEGASKFSDNTFDWVYIDADHSYNGCKDDLNAYKDKVKEDGYICGHDYLREGFELPGYGTNQAVDDFVSENNYFLTILTNEKKHKSYAISKNKESHERLLVKANQTQ